MDLRYGTIKPHVIASDSVAIFDRKVDDKHIEDCHGAIAPYSNDGFK